MLEGVWDHLVNWNVLDAAVAQNSRIKMSDRFILCNFQKTVYRSNLASCIDTRQLEDSYLQAKVKKDIIHRLKKEKSLLLQLPVNETLQKVTDTVARSISELTAHSLASPDESKVLTAQQQGS